MCDLAFRNLIENDHQPITSVVDDWWGGRPVAGLLPRLFFSHFNDTSFVIEGHGRIVAFLIGFISQSRPDEAYIHFVGVHPEYRRRKLARRLYEGFFERAKSRGCGSVGCITSPVNKTSIAFHRSIGFQIEPGDAQIEGIDAIADYEQKGQPRVVFKLNL